MSDTLTTGVISLKHAIHPFTSLAASTRWSHEYVFPLVAQTGLYINGHAQGVCAGGLKDVWASHKVQLAVRTESVSITVANDESCPISQSPVAAAAAAAATAGAAAGADNRSQMIAIQRSCRFHT